MRQETARTAAKQKRKRRFPVTNAAPAAHRETDFRLHRALPSAGRVFCKKRRKGVSVRIVLAFPNEIFL